MEKCEKCNSSKSVNSYCAFRECLTTSNNHCKASDPIITLTTLSEDEAAACMELVQKMRAEKGKEEKIQKIKSELALAVSEAIPEIGMEEVKKIVRELNRNLRDSLI